MGEAPALISSSAPFLQGVWEGVTVTHVPMEGGCCPLSVTSLLQVEPADGRGQDGLRAGTKTGTKPLPKSLGTATLSLCLGHRIPP